MNIQEELRHRIGDEFLEAARRMEEERAALAKLYWFTAAFHMANRVMNLEYDPELIFLFTVCQNAHQEISARILALTGGVDLAAGVPDGLFERLRDVTKDLGEAIKDNVELTPLMQRVAILGYSATGNGYYLWKRGFLNLD